MSYKALLMIIAAKLMEKVTKYKYFYHIFLLIS